MATFEKLSSNKVKLSFVVAPEKFDEALQTAYHKMVKKISIPGFRKGHAPMKVIENYYGASVFYEEAMDVLFPTIGEIIGGSEREENYDKLLKRIEELNIPMKDMWWYLDTRRFGTVPHSGFGLGFERLVLFVTGMANIRDVIPFPRYPKSADF